MFSSMSLSLLLLVHLQKSALAGGGEHEVAAAGWRCPSGTECVKKLDDYAGVRIRYPPGSGFLGGRFGRSSAGSRVPCSVAACVGPCAPGDLTPCPPAQISARCALPAHMRPRRRMGMKVPERRSWRRGSTSSRSDVRPRSAPLVPSEHRTAPSPITLQRVRRPCVRRPRRLRPHVKHC